MKITYHKGVTINIGNFESVRLDLTVEDEEEVFQEGLEIIKERVDEAIAEMEKEERKIGVSKKNSLDDLVI